MAVIKRVSQTIKRKSITATSGNHIISKLNNGFSKSKNGSKIIIKKS